MHFSFQNPYGLQLYHNQTQNLLNVCYMNPDNQFLLSLLSKQNHIIEKLLENQNVLTSRIQTIWRHQTTDTEQSPNQGESQRPFLSYQQMQSYGKKINTILLQTQSQKSNKLIKSNAKRIQIVSNCPQPESINQREFQQNGQISQHQKDQVKIQKGCETKNIIKNYGKSILTFLKKNEELMKRILKENEFDQIQFFQQFKRFRDRLNSITELKQFWTEEGNKFAKVFRIISSIYLRKHSLRHTFKSRVRNFGIHIKYRTRLMDVLKNPQDFNSIKYI